MALPKLRQIPGWERTFLQAISNGYSEKTAANAAGISTVDVKRRMEKDPKFKSRYEETFAARKPRPAGGLF